MAVKYRTTSGWVDTHRIVIAQAQGYTYNATLAEHNTLSGATAVAQTRASSGGTVRAWNSASLTRLGLVPVSTGVADVQQSLSARGRSTYGLEFDFTGTEFDVEAASGWVQVWADDEQVGSAVEVGTGQSVRVALPSAATRRIVVEIGSTSVLTGGTSSNPVLTGIRHLDGAVVAAPARRRLFILGDSWVEGAAYGADGVNAPAMRHMAWVAGRYAGADVYYNGKSGSGYDAASNFGNHYGAASRVAQVVSAAPDDVLIFGSINDFQGTDVTTAADALYTTLAAQLPGANVVVVGRQSYNNSTNTNGADEDIEAGIVGNANVVGYVSPRAEAWITGTGNTVSPSGSGTADLYHNGSNLQHLSDAGNLYYGRKLAQALATLIPA